MGFSRPSDGIDFRRRLFHLSGERMHTQTTHVRAVLHLEGLAGEAKKDEVENTFVILLSFHFPSSHFFLLGRRRRLERIFFIR